MIPTPAHFTLRLSTALHVATLLMAAAAPLLTLFNILEPPDWDMVHELYYGQRLILHGELIWTHEFHDKTPFVQLLFAIPAYFQHIWFYHLVTLASVAAAGVALIHLTPPRAVSSAYPPALQRRVRVFAAVLFWATLVTLQARLFNLNTASTSLTLITFLLLFRTTSSPTLPPLRMLL
ncbi:MAG: hypothetical protein WAZ18_03890, partial [Alphaproteobacteria bacterium]